LEKNDKNLLRKCYVFLQRAYFPCIKF